MHNGCHQRGTHHHGSPHSSTHDHGAMISDFKIRFWISSLLTLPVLLLSPMVQLLFFSQIIFAFKGDSYLLFFISSLIFFYGGWPFLKGLVSEVKALQPGMMTLIAIAITTAYIYSVLVVFGLSGEMFFGELATLIDIMLLGHWIEMKSVLGAGKALEELARLMPAVAHQVMPDGSTRDVVLHQLGVNDIVLIKPGEKVPADGVVIAGESSVNEAMLTGESKPISKQKGSSIIGGAINGEGSLTVRVKKTGKDSFLSQVIDLVRQAQDSKSKTQDIANRAALWLTFIALFSGALTLLVWAGFSTQSFAFALERTVTVMIITCPHALGLAVPLVVAVSTALAAKQGLLIRNRAAFEQARHVNAIVFDKTGTLTEGKFGITDVVLLDTTRVSEEELLNYAGAVEAHSEHLIAKAIAQASKERWGSGTI